MNKGTFLGTGASLGTPVPLCLCNQCQSSSANRLRSSLLYTINGINILFDISPDFRAQSLLHDITHVDIACITHVHYDHIGGFDDIRAFLFKQKRDVEIVAHEDSFLRLEETHGYMLNQKSLPIKKRILSEERGAFSIEFIDIEYFSYSQQGMRVLGYKVGDFAYITDIKEYSEGVFNFLEGVDTLVIGGLTAFRSNGHFTRDDIIKFINRVNPKKAFITHIDHSVDIGEALPERVSYACDGLTFFCNGVKK